MCVTQLCFENCALVSLCPKEYIRCFMSTELKNNWHLYLLVTSDDFLNSSEQSREKLWKLLSKLSDWSTPVWAYSGCVGGRESLSFATSHFFAWMLNYYWITGCALYPISSLKVKCCLSHELIEVLWQFGIGLPACLELMTPVKIWIFDI